MATAARGPRPWWRRALHQDSGFTMIEMIVSLAVATGIFTALAYLGTTAISSMQAARNNQQAIDLATQKLEAARALSFGALGHDAATIAADTAVGTCNGDPCIDPGTGTSEDVVIVGGGIANHLESVAGETSNNVSYQFATYITEPADSASGNTRRVTVRATWSDGSRTLSRSVSTLVAESARGLPLPKYSVSPVGQTTQSINPGADAVFGLTVQNQGAPDQFNITLPTGFTAVLDDGDGIYSPADDYTSLTDSTSDGVIDTGRLDPDSAVTFWAIKTTQASDPEGTTQHVISFDSVAQPGTGESVILTVVLIDGVISASPTPSPTPSTTASDAPTSSPSPTPTPTPTGLPTPEPTELVACSATATPTPTPQNQYTVTQYTLHNSGTSSWPTLPLPAAPGPVEGSSAFDVMYVDQNPDAIGATYWLPSYSLDHATYPNTAGRVLASGGSFAATNGSVADFRGQVPKRQYDNSAVLRVWAGAVPGVTTSSITLNAQVYRYDTSNGTATQLGSAATRTVSPFSCAGLEEFWFDMPLGKINLGNNEVIGVRVWNSSSVPVRIGYDHETYPGSFTVVQK